MLTPEDLGLDTPAHPPLPPPPAEPAPGPRRRRADPDGPVGPALWTLLRRRLRQVRRADAAVPDDPADPGHGDALHRLRIAVKRLRYVGEVAALVLPADRAEPAAALLGTLAALQDELGETHDADVLTELAAAHRGSGGEAGWAALAEVVAAERERHRTRAEELLAGLRPDRWQAVRRPFRALRADRPSRRRLVT
jgi:CHAD domain-containing protein